MLEESLWGKACGCLGVGEGRNGAGCRKGRIFISFFKGRGGKLLGRN